MVKQSLLDKEINELLQSLTPTEVVMPVIECVVKAQSHYAATMCAEFFPEGKANVQ